MIKLVARVRSVTGRARHSIGTASPTGQPMATSDFSPATRVEIEPAGGDSPAQFLIRYDAHGNFAGDTWHRNVADAMAQAEWEYEIRQADWTEISAPDERDDS